MSPIAKLLYGLAFSACLVGLIEAGARLLYGDPPGSSSLWNTTRCNLREEQGQAWIECGWVHGKSDRWSVLESPDTKQKPRVVVLGGSSVYNAMDANPWVNFPSALQRLLPEVEVVNLGTTGMQSAGVLWFSEQLDVLNPDILIVYTGHNDYNQMVFTGSIKGTQLWMIPIQRFLDRSWIYGALALRTKGRLPEFKHAVGDNQDEPEICPSSDETLPLFLEKSSTTQNRRGGHWLSGMNRKLVLPMEDDTALQVRHEVSARLERNLRSIVRRSKAPVILMTLMRNVDYHPAGAMVAQQDRCRRALSCLSTATREQAHLLLDYSRATCGESSITAWIEALTALEAGKLAEASSAFDRSLDLDPLPLRAPSAADEIIRRVSEEEGATLVDLQEILGPVFEGKLFTDNLHLSVEGAASVAAALAPTVSEVLAD